MKSRLFLLLFLVGFNAITWAQKTTTDLIYKRFVGTINEKYPIVLHLTQEQKQCYGSYYYEKVGQNLILSGSCSKNAVRLSEYNRESKLSGIFVGTINGNTFSGIWKNGVDSSKTMPFSVTENYDNAMSASLTAYKNVNCELADKNRKKKELESWCDTTCMEIALTMLKLTKETEIAKMLNKKIESTLLDKRTLEQYLNVSTTSEEYYPSSSEEEAHIHTNDKGFLTVSYSMYRYECGAAHGMAGVAYMNYDLATGKELDTSNVFITGYYPKLASIAERFLFQQNGDEGWNFEKGKFPLNSNFAIELTGVRFLFQQYEIAPYSAGMPEVFIPYKEIKDLINPKSPVAKLLK